MSEQAKKQTPDTWDDATLGVDDRGALAALDKAGARAGALIDAWTAHSNAAALSEVAERGSGAVRKAARRAVNVLKARGAKIPERHRVATLSAQPGDERTEAWLVPPDSSGGVVVSIGSHSTAKRGRACMVFLHDGVGVSRIETGELSQSALKEALNKLPLPGLKPIAVPAEWARHRIAAALARHRANGLPDPMGLTNARALIEPAPEAAPEHPFDTEGLELAAEDAKELAAQSVKLHALPEFRSWFPSKTAVDEMLVNVGKTLAPGQEPNQSEIQEKFQNEVLAATDRYFTPEVRQELVRTMKDAALSVLTRLGEANALEVVATMKMIENAGLITDPPRDIGFLRGFFDKALSLLLAQNGGRLRIPVSGMPADADDGAPAEAPEPTPEATP
jgi:hypothetical protein